MIEVMGISLMNGNRTFKKYRKYHRFETTEELEQFRKQQEDENPGYQIAFYYKQKTKQP
jgi:hypothetical protein